MTAIIERCAGIDVGKKFITVCVLIGTADADPTAEKRMFGTFNAELEALRQWLREQGCTHIAMESTGHATCLPRMASAALRDYGSGLGQSNRAGNE
jgi:hypothetical protein